MKKLIESFEPYAVEQEFGQEKKAKAHHRRLNSWVEYQDSIDMQKKDYWYI